MVSILYVD